MARNRFEIPRSYAFRGEQLFRGIGSLCIVGSVAVSGGGAETNVSSGDSVKAAPVANIQPAEPEYAPVDETDHHKLSDLQIVIIDNPQHAAADDTTPKQAEQVLHTAGNAMSETTDGVLTMPAFVPIHTIDQHPTGKFKQENKIVACISDDDIDNARKKAFQRDGVSLLTRTGVIINDYPSCKDNEAGAWAWNHNGSDLTVYSAKFIPYYVAHEEGHIEGLEHSSAIACSATSNDKSTFDNMVAWSKTDIRKLISRNICTVPLNEDGDKDEYADVNTTMGDKESITPGHDVYSFTEINKLSPEAAKIINVQPEAQKYVLGIGDKDLRGVRFVLPWTHPLRNIDPSLQFLNVGLGETGDNETELHVIATGNGISYDLSYTYPYMPTLDADTEIKQTLYTDNTLGITISAEGVKKGAGYRGDKALIDIALIPQ
jgi:hypothetical protein